MNVTVWLKGKRIYIPTVFTTQGIHRSMPPVDILPVDDAAGVSAILIRRMIRGKVTIPPQTYEERERQSKITLQAFGFRSWSTFMRNASPWDIAVRNGCFVIQGYRKGDMGGFVPYSAQVTVFAPDTPIEAVASRMVAILQETAAKGPRKSTARKSVVDTTVVTGPVRLADGKRIDELGDFLEWLANAEPEDAAAIRSEIERYYYDAGDREAGDALTAALDKALTPGVTRADREAILESCERYTRRDPARRRR